MTMTKALRAILSASMALALVGCASAPVAPAEAPSAPEITIEDQYTIHFGGWDDITVKTYCRNGDYWVATRSYREGGAEIHTELNERCKD